MPPANSPFLIVAADFVQTGGMDRPNLALAEYLAGRGSEVHLVTHRAEDSVSRLERTRLHMAPKPLRSYLLGEPFLGWIGAKWAEKITALGGRVVVNGGNCYWGDVNWVHYVHAAYTPAASGGALRRLKGAIAHRIALHRERKALPRARLVIANSERTRADLIRFLGIPPDRVRTVYYGIDPSLFSPRSDDERAAARARLGWAADRPMLVFIGGLGDRRKGFATLFEAWKRLCADPAWDSVLVVIGAGAELPAWRKRAGDAGLGDRIAFLGFRTDVPEILAACDLLVAPTHYEAYGLAVQEALCQGVPALVTRTAGVAERYPPDLAELLISDPADVTELVERLLHWSVDPRPYREATVRLAEVLRAHSWERMAAQVVGAIEET